MRLIKKMKSMEKLGKQRGVVLIVSLVFLVALTAVAAALMQNSTTDMKMAGASEQKVVAMQDAISAVDEVILTHKRDGFVRPIQGDNFPIVNALPVLPSTSATASVVVANNFFSRVADCPHARVASSSEVFDCNVLRVVVNRAYGRKGNSNIQVSSGITQRLLGQQ